MKKLVVYKARLGGDINYFASSTNDGEFFERGMSPALLGKTIADLFLMRNRAGGDDFDLRICYQPDFGTQCRGQVILEIKELSSDEIAAFKRGLHGGEE